MRRDLRTKTLVYSVVTDEIRALDRLLFYEHNDLEIRLHFLNGFGFLHEGVDIIQDCN
jgi:hypothetical protein